MQNAGEEKTLSPLQDISSYFFSPEFKDKATAVQARHSSLFAIKRRITPDSQRPGGKIAARLEKAGINLAQDAAIDEALQEYADSTRRTETTDHSQYDYVLLNLITVADAHMIPHHNALYADDHMAEMGYRSERPKLIVARDALMQEAETTRDNDAIGFLNGVIARIDNFTRIATGQGTGDAVHGTHNSENPRSAPQIRKRGRPAKKERIEGADSATPPATRTI